MTPQEYFKDAVSYAASAERTIRGYFESLGYHCEYTFVQDLILAEWFGLDKVRETYETFKREWLGDYKAWTEVVMSLNLLIWFHDGLIENGIEENADAEELYDELYFKSKDDFYDKYTGNEEACNYFFQCTD